jgi:hypothetical protein
LKKPASTYKLHTYTEIPLNYSQAFIITSEGMHGQWDIMFLHEYLLKSLMKLLNTYDDRDAAEEAKEKLIGNNRLASERDSTVVIYNLFGIPNWGNFHRLGMYNLGELRSLLDRRDLWQPADQLRHAAILTTLQTVAKNYDIDVPNHWL